MGQERSITYYELLCKFSGLILNLNWVNNELMSKALTNVMGQKGSVLLVLLVLVAASVAGYLLVFKNIPASKLPLPAKVAPILQMTPSGPKVYKDERLNFQFEYPSSAFEVVPDSEESYFKIAQTDHRKNFTGYVGYKPPEFVSGIILKGSGSKIESQYTSIPLILWVFENPNKLSIDAWFDRYWYYPFVWGIFAQPGKGHIYPAREATIAGQLAKSVVVSYQPGQPEFIYVPKGDKMFMFRVIKGSAEKAVTQALQSFKFAK